MKINPNNSTLVSKKDKKSSTKVKKPTSFFSSLFAPIEALEQDLANNDLDHESIMEQLEEIGRELILKRNMGSLNRYKKEVRSLLEEFNKKAHSTSFIVGGSHTNNHNQLQISKIINDNLVDVTNKIMGQEKSSLDLAATIDSIKGLLVDYVK